MGNSVIPEGISSSINVGSFPFAFRKTGITNIGIRSTEFCRLLDCIWLSVPISPLKHPRLHLTAFSKKEIYFKKFLVSSSSFLHGLLTQILRQFFRASLVAQWLRLCLPMQGTRVRSLVWEDPTCCGATRPVCHNYWDCASGACAPQQERPR